MKKQAQAEIKRMSVEVTNVENKMNSGDTLVSTTDLKGRVIYANQEFLRIAEMEPNEMFGKPHNIVRHPDMPRSAFHDFWETLKAGRPWRGIVKNRAKSGNYYWVDANVAPRVENGNIVGYISVRRKPSPEQVHKASNLYRDIMNGKAIFPPTIRKGVSIRFKLGLLFFMSGAAIPMGVLLGAMGLNQVLTMTISLLLGGAFFASGLFMVSRLLLQPLRRATELANQIAEGDLSANIPHKRNDEIGVLNQALLTMLINTGGLIAQIKESSTIMENTSVQLTEAGQNLSSGTEQTSQQSEAIAASATQMNGNLQALASAIEQMSISIKEVSRKAAESASVMDQANTTAESTDSIVKDLGDNATEIGKVIDTISGIAAQTRLLALNATIEAAGAGDAGKGFAVVATEVKELARQSAESSEEIKIKISAIQKSADEAVKAIGAINTVIGQVNEISASIASAVEEQSMTAVQVAANISETSRSSTEVTSNITGISTAARDGARDAGNSSRQAETMRDLAGKLTSIVNKFRISQTGSAA